MRKKKLNYFGHCYYPCAVKPSNILIETALSWIELYRDDEKILLITEKLIDWDSFDNSYEMFEGEKNVTWKVSNIRNNLNTSFYKNMFTDREKEMILKSNVVQKDSDSAVKKITTKDYLFLLSAEEVKKYLAEKEAEMVLVDTFDSKITMERFCCAWWLRTPGKTPNTMCVVENGKIDEEGVRIEAEEVGIRPAMWVDRKKYEVYQKKMPMSP